MSIIKSRPNLSEADARSAFEHTYDLEVSSIRPLDGERDQNFRVVTRNGRGFVLKVCNSEESVELLEAQNDALQRLRADCDFVPLLQLDRNGNAIGKIDSGDLEFRVRAVSYLPGRPLARLKRPSRYLLDDLGAKLGQIARSLQGFDRPVLHRPFAWNLMQGASVVRESTQLIADGVTRRIVASLVDRIEPILNELGPPLRKSVIHNDANDFNVIVSDDRDEFGERLVSGIIDLGDMAWSYVAAELAIAMAYVVCRRDDWLDAACELTRGYHGQHPLEGVEIAALYELMLLRLCTSICMSEQQQRDRPDDPYLSISQEPIRRVLPELAAADSQLVERALRDACGLRDVSTGIGSTQVDVIREARKRRLGPNLSVAYREPLVIVRGDMQYLYDDAGRQFLDAYNNVPHVGHCHPRVVEAASRQMAVLNTNTRYLHPLQIEYAERLCATLPDALEVCYFLNSASEANELALRLARSATERHGVVVQEAAYHGHTTTLIDVSPYKHDGPGGRGAPPWVHKVPLPDCFRGEFRSDICGGETECGELYAQRAVEIMHSAMNGEHPPAAFLAETCPSVGGQIIPPSNYLPLVYEAAKSCGVITIADEVQTGFGRLGSHFWAFERFAVTPDIVVTGKPIGNGHPLAAVVTTREIADQFDNGMEFFSTFGGNTVSCAVGIAVLDVIEREGLQDRALATGKVLEENFHGMKEAFPIIGDVRGSGLFWGVELVRDRQSLEPADREATLMVNRMRERGILIGTDGPLHNVLKIRPPMQFDRDNAITLSNTLTRILDEEFND